MLKPSHTIKRKKIEVIPEIKCSLPFIERFKGKINHISKAGFLESIIKQEDKDFVQNLNKSKISEIASTTVTARRKNTLKSERSCNMDKN